MNPSSLEIGRRIAEELGQSIEVKRRVVADELETLAGIAQLLIRALRAGHKIVLFGNGGSAADAQHIAAELVSRFRRDRIALPAIALTTDTSILTSVANDYGYADVFARQIEALGQAGDAAIAISTSGNSPNVIKGARTARERGMTTVGLTGEDGGALKDCVDICLRVPSRSTARIQEVHITVGHALCELIEEAFAEREAGLAIHASADTSL